MLEAHRAALPDLTGVTLVVPQAALAAALRVALVQEAGGALLMPRVLTLRALAAPDTPPASALACQMRLAEAVSRFRFLFPGQAPLRVAEALYTLFDELEREAVTLPEDEAELEALLQKGYGAAAAMPALSREAQIVHRLHRAFREELGDRAPAVAEREALARTLARWPAETPLWFVGFDTLTRSEAAAIRSSLALPHTRFVTQGASGRAAIALHALLESLGLGAEERAPVGDRGQWLSTAFALELSAHARAATLRGRALDLGDLALIHAADPEHEAQCADLAVREALLAGARRITVVSDDRRLARRLRARLERAGIALTDAGGWALSTSRAAAALDAWLDCVELDFPLRPFMALLKSGLIEGGRDWADALEPRAYRRMVIAGGASWRELLEPAETARWANLQHAARVFGSLGGSAPAAGHAEALLQSLDRLGLSDALAADVAGARVLARLQELRDALAATGLQLSWRAFRALLDRVLEDANFPSASGTADAVQLLTLAQTQGLAADAVILTGATARLFTPAATPFFNRGVRRELGLPAAGARQALTLARLTRLLEAAPRVRVLLSPEEAGEEATLAPPLAALVAFGAAADHPLPEDLDLAERASRAEVAADSPLPSAATRSAPAATAALLAAPLFAHDHQRLVECPYAFHAATALGLEALKEPDDPVGRDEFGRRVHRILCAFERQTEALPPPYAGPREDAERPAIEAHLATLAQAVFAADLAERPLARFWAAEFAAAIPWLARQLTAKPAERVEVEQKLSAERDGWTLAGRADRIEYVAEGARLVDYKTGRSATAAEIAAGEAVQLPHYALLAGTVHAAEYWSLKDRRVTGLDREALEALLPLVSARLGQLVAELARGAPLPAHGEEAVCAHCDFIGVCRRLDLP